jgi:endonuclease/exonuclease/phosphatase family metal-dependent hydrolase
MLRPAGFRGVDRRPLTFPAWGPVRPLDAIFVRGQCEFVKLSRCESELARRASDHRPLIADVRLHPHHAHHHGAHEHKPPSPRP